MYNTLYYPVNPLQNPFAGTAAGASRCATGGEALRHPGLVSLEIHASPFFVTPEQVRHGGFGLQRDVRWERGDRRRPEDQAAERISASGSAPTTRFRPPCFATYSAVSARFSAAVPPSADSSGAMPAEKVTWPIGSCVAWLISRRVPLVQH